MDVEICRQCGQHVLVMCQYRTGFCTPRCQEEYEASGRIEQEEEAEAEGQQGGARSDEAPVDGASEGADGEGPVPLDEAPGLIAKFRCYCSIWGRCGWCSA